MDTDLRGVFSASNNREEGQNVREKRFDQARRVFTWSVLALFPVVDAHILTAATCPYKIVSGR